MLPVPAPFYLTSTFWTAVAAVVAFTALILSQLPPLRLLLTPKRLDVGVYDRIQIFHKIGNPNIGLHMTLGNTGGRELRIRAMRLNLSRDNKPLGSFPAKSYLETPSSQSSSLFVPFSLKPGEEWSHFVSFVNWFDRETEKNYRENESALRSIIQKKVEERAPGDIRAVTAEPQFVAPFIEIFNKLFIWEPGEYIIELVIDAEPNPALNTKKYRFTLYESDTAEMRKPIKDAYPGGFGIYIHHASDAGLFVQLSEHLG